MYEYLARYRKGIGRALFRVLGTCMLGIFGFLNGPFRGIDNGEFIFFKSFILGSSLRLCFLHPSVSHRGKSHVRGGWQSQRPARRIAYPFLTPLNSFPFPSAPNYPILSYPILSTTSIISALVPPAQSPRPALLAHHPPGFRKTYNPPPHSLASVEDRGWRFTSKGYSTRGDAELCPHRHDISPPTRSTSNSSVMVVDYLLLRDEKIARLIAMPTRKWILALLPRIVECG